MYELILNNFIILVVVIDPIGLAPIFAALTHGGDVFYRRRMALRGVALAASIMLVFALAGDRLLNALGIGLPAFRVAGGALLFLLAIDMVFARHSGLRAPTPREQEEAQHKQDISVFPLAFPLIAGPGALTTILLMRTQQEGMVALLGVLGVLLVVLLLALGVLLWSGRIVHLLGETGANVVSRLLGLVLAALAVQFMLDGIHASFPAH